MGTIKKCYLFTYNSVCLYTWLRVLSLVIYHFWEGDSVKTLNDTVDGPLKLAQTLALLEIAHSLFGIVRSPLITTILQVASRLAIVWGVCFPAPVATQQIGYATMLLSWSVTEVIRYPFYALNLFSKVPGFLKYLRYSMFIVLYPTGILSEMSCIYYAFYYVKSTSKWSFPMPNALNFGWEYHIVIAVASLSYLYGAPLLYSYMCRQRKKVLYGKSKTN
eukprot:69099_1